jgi:hypothetical protein
MYYMHDPQHSMCTVHHKTYNVHHAAFRQLLLRRTDDHRPSHGGLYHTSHITYHTMRFGLQQQHSTHSAQRAVSNTRSRTRPNNCDTALQHPCELVPTGGNEV